MDGANLWWGYKHINGSFQVKRYFSPLDLKEARESPFVRKVFDKFTAKNRQDALEHVSNQ